MSLINGSLHIGETAIRVNQAALQVVGQNIANASDPDYSRQQAVMSPSAGGTYMPGISAGSGVELTTIKRIADEAINARLRSAIADQYASQAANDVLTQMETVFNALGDDNISTRLSDFFNALSDLANDPQSTSRRTVVMQAAGSLVQGIQSAQESLVSLRLQVNAQIGEYVSKANDLIDQVADLNDQITRIEFGMENATAGALHDQRDKALRELSQLIDIHTTNGTAGAVNVYVGSVPLVMQGTAYQLSVDYDRTIENPDLYLRSSAENQRINVTGGDIGGLIAARDGDLAGAMDKLDQFTLALINQVNRIHSQGQGLTDYTSVVGATAVGNINTALSAQDLPLMPLNGAFTLSLTNAAGVRSDYTIAIDLDGLGSDMTLSDLAGAINGLGNVSATARPDGKLQIDGENGYTISFSNDTSGVLAALGINTFFSGTNANTIAIRDGMTGSRIAASTNHSPADNSNALALAALATTALADVNYVTLGDYFNNLSTDVSASAANWTAQSDANTALTDALQSQRDSASGVNIDEETIDMLKYQRAFQASARYINVINQLIQEVLDLVQ